MPLELQDRTPNLPPRVLIYGPPGLGKTSLGDDFPNAVFLQPEDSTVKGRVLKSFGHLTSFDAIMTGIENLYNQDHDRKTVVLDTIDATEPLVWEETCKRNNWTDIEAPGYGKGYIAADDVWKELFRGLNALRTGRNMNVVLIGHSEIERFDDPATTSYSRYDFRLQKRGHAIIEDDMDVVLFLNQDPTIKLDDTGFGKKRARAEGCSRWIHTERRPAWNAKNRYEMPAQILYEAGKGYEAMKDYFPAQELPEPPRARAHPAAMAA